MNSSFCVMPFYGAEYKATGFIRHCCFMSSTYDIEKVKTEMLAGIRPVECQKCWHLEDSGIQSDRQLKNSAFDYYKDKDINQIINDCKNGTYSEQIVKLYTSNLCNSTCTTCSPVYSSKWQQLKSMPIKNIAISDEKLKELDWANITMLSLVGGEPLYERKNFTILEKLLEHKNVNCFISIVTNGSVKLSQQQQEILKKFKNLNVCFSIDGIGTVFEYLRYPLLWEDLLFNLTQYKNLGATISVSYTLSNLNATYYQQTIDWFNSKNLQYNHNLVIGPPYFNVEVLPTEFKQNLPFIKHPNVFDKNLFHKCIQEIEKQDQLKGIKIKDYLPEVFEIFKNFQEN